MRLRLVHLFLLVSFAGHSQKFYLFIGTYTGTGSKGIYVYRFDAGAGKAEWVSNTDSAVNPSFLAMAPNGKQLYACTETRTVNAGGVTAYSFDRGSGQLRQLNRQTSGGDNPCYVNVHKAGKWVVVGNYSGGSLAVYPLNADGSLQPFSQLIQHEGRSVNKDRQEKAHVHAAVFSPAQDHLFVPDLGLDKVLVYRFNPAAPKPLAPAPVPFAQSTPGSGPRHFTFHPNGRWAYLVQELAGAVVAYRYRNGTLTQTQRLFSHPDTLSTLPGSADVHVSPDGKFLYASNRGKENNIAVFRINPANGKLTAVGYEPTRGLVPRNFCIDPTGTFLLVANQESDNVVVFRRNRQTGLLTYTGVQLSIPKPVCLKMMP